MLVNCGGEKESAPCEGPVFIFDTFAEYPYAAGVMPTGAVKTATVGRRLDPAWIAYHFATADVKMPQLHLSLSYKLQSTC